MSRLHDAFDALIAEHPPGDPDAVLARARAEAAGDLRTRRRAVSGLVAAAAVVLLVLGAAVVLTRGDGADDVRTGSTNSAVPSTRAVPAEVDVVIHLSKGTDDGCTRTEAVTRTVPGADPIRGAFDSLVEGATPEEQRAGLSTWFWWETEGSVRSVRVEDGTAFVDFDDIAVQLNNASTSCGSASLLAQLDGTAEQFPGVERTVYSFEGDVDAFYSWLGMDPPEGFDEDRAPGFAAPVTAVASKAGVSVTDDTGTQTRITADPARVAFVAGDQVAFQGDDPDDTTSPIDPGPVRVWRDGQVRTVSFAPEATTTLLDAAIVGGTPVVLVGEVVGTTPDDTFETLVTVDLSTGAVASIARIPAWESGTIQAQLLPDGSVVRLGDGEGHTFLQRWSADEPEVVWSEEVEVTSMPTLAVDDAGATVISVLPIDGERQTLRLARFDLEAGTARPAEDVSLDGAHPLPVWCQDWLAEGELSCSRTGEEPVAVLLDGRVRPLPSEPGARITVSG